MRKRMIQDPDVRSYFNTLLLLPDDVVLDLATREFNMQHMSSCLCGWSMRAGLSRINGQTPDEIRCGSHAYAMVRQFGGTIWEWSGIFFGVTDHRLPKIEFAFEERLNVALSEGV